MTPPLDVLFVFLDIKIAVDNADVVQTQVTKDVPPYSIYVGQPGVKLRPRWDAATIAEHEQLLGSRSKI